MPEFTKRTFSGAMQRHFVRAVAQQDTESARMYLEHEGTAHLDCLTPDALLAMRLIATDIGFTLFSDPLHLIQEIKERLHVISESQDDMQCTTESRRTDYTVRELREHASVLKQPQQSVASLGRSITDAARTGERELYELHLCCCAPADLLHSAVVV
jgi:hypothetical protein